MTLHLFFDIAENELAGQRYTTAWWFPCTRGRLRISWSKQTSAQLPCLLVRDITIDSKLLCMLMLQGKCIIVSEAECTGSVLAVLEATIIHND